MGGVYLLLSLFLQTIFAHGVHLQDEELELLKMKKSGICHCPNSNISLVIMSKLREYH